MTTQNFKSVGSVRNILFLSVCGLILAGSVVSAAALQPEGRAVVTMRVRQLESICNQRFVPAGHGYTGMPSGRPQCTARILGTVDGLDAMQTLAHGRKLFCLPRGAGWQEKFRVVRQYMARHPETMSVDVGMMAAEALARAYPCRRY